MTKVAMPTFGVTETFTYLSVLVYSLSLFRIDELVRDSTTVRSMLNLPFGRNLHQSYEVARNHRYRQDVIGVNVTSLYSLGSELLTWVSTGLGQYLLG